MDHTRLPRATGEDSRPHRRGPCRLGSGTAGSPGPNGRSGASDGAPHHVAVPAQPRRGCGKGECPSPEPWRGQALWPGRPPGTHGTPHARPRGRLRRLQRKGSAEPPTPLPRKADSRHPRPATRPPPGGAPAPAGTAKAPLSPSAGVRIRRPQAESMPCEPAPQQRCLRTQAAYLTQGRGLVENSSCPGGAVKPLLERNKIKSVTTRQRQPRAP